MNAKVFANSTVCKKLRSGEINQIFLNLMPGYDTLPNYIIGDLAYPLAPYCMKECQTRVGNKQVVFNNLLRIVRNQTECPFGRVLTKTVDSKFEIIPTVVYSCFVLHNFCESKNYSGLDEEEVEVQIMRHRLEEQNNISLPDPICCNIFVILSPYKLSTKL